MFILIESTQQGGGGGGGAQMFRPYMLKGGGWSRKVLPCLEP